MNRNLTNNHGVGAVIVTHNSDHVAERAVDALLAGDLVPDVVVVVDNASANSDYLNRIEQAYDSVIVIRQRENVGFCAGNNLGLPLVGNRHVLLVNPDAFVSPTFLSAAVAALKEDEDIGAIGPTLLRADAETGLPTGTVDSMGIQQTRWGRLYDRAQGDRADQHVETQRSQPSALCAATVLLRREAVLSVLDRGHLLDDAYFMYKEDIDLSWRVRRAGWKVVHDPALVALHCRGWSSSRREVPRWARRRSLHNEWRLWRKGWAPDQARMVALPYLAAKTIVVLAGW